MKIDIHKLLLYNRNQSVDENLVTKQERWSIILWKKGMLNRKIMDRLGSRLKNFLLEVLFNQSWGKRRSLPKLSEKSFNQLWREKHTQKRD
jgi:L-lactate dehydrogenase complex protein LldF